MPKLLLGLLAAALAYPPAPRGDTVDDYHGTRVPAPYRWMEDLDSPQLKQWIEAENKITFDYLAGLPEREALRKRLTELWNYPRTDEPDREAGQLFYRRNSGLQPQSALYRAPGVTVLDPNLLSPDGSTAMAQWRVSPDARWLAYSTAHGGSDVRDLHVRDLRSGKDLTDLVPRVKFTGISWTRDAKGFVYGRFKGSESAASFGAENLSHQVWYHPLGGKDRLLHEEEDPREMDNGSVSDDGRWLFLSTRRGTTNNKLAVADLRDAKRPRFDQPYEVVSGEDDAIVRPLGVMAGRLYLYTNYQAPNGRIVTAAIGDSDRSRWKTVVAEDPKEPIAAEQAPLLVRGVIALVRYAAVRSRLLLFDAQGKPLGEVPLPEPGTVQNLSAHQEDPDFFFDFTSVLRPRTLYRYVLATKKLEAFLPPPAVFDPAPYQTRQVFYSSKDGTRVPMFITARKDLKLDGSHPAMLYAYGGFELPTLPVYSASVAAWLEQGAIYATANLRGGSEYGEAWHRAGMREKKQNVFDDFIAAAGYLEREGYTSPQHLVIYGRSNGGLLIGAVENQRPDLFAATLPTVGVMDMLRYQKFTGGALWSAEYGSSDDPAMFPALLAYSPLQNVKQACHPATLVITADRDDRVVPSHSFQYAAAMQAGQACDKPVLIRVETAGSHGYRPTERVIAEVADMWSFALANIQ